MRLGMGLGLGNLLSGGPITGMSNKYSFNFDGSNDYLDLGTDLESWVESPNKSFSAWVKNDGNTSQARIFNVGYNDSGNLTGFGIGLTKTTNNKPFYFLRQADGSALYEEFGDVLNTTDWYHFFIAIDGSANEAYIYQNGALKVTVSNVGEPAQLTDKSAKIGVAWYDTTQQHFNGLIDEVAIWDSAITDTSVIAKISSKPVDLTKYSASNLKLWLRAGDKVLPEEDTSIARSDFYTDFDGTNDYVDVSDDSSLDLSGTGYYSIFAWVKAGVDIASDTFTIVNKYSTNAGWILGVTTTNNLRWETGDGSAIDTTKSANNSYPETVGLWQHIGVTGGGGGKAKLYLNGNELGSLVTDNDHDTIATNTADMLIGTAPGAGSGFWNGNMSNLSIYQTAIDAQTIKQFAKSRFTPMRDNRFSVVDFDGSDDVIAMTTSSAVSPTEAITVSAWVNFTSLEDYDLVVGNTDTGSNGWRLAMDNADNIIFAINSWGSNHAETPMSSTGVWHHLVGTYDKSNIKIYLDGELKDTDSYTDSITYSSNVFQIGGASGWSNLTGSISSVAIYSDAKDADFIYAQYQKGITHNPSADTGLVGLWRMGDDTSKAYPTIADSSSNSNDGTITNGASDDIQQQAVAMYDMGSYDHSTEELGGEVVNDPTFSTDLASGGTNSSFKLNADASITGGAFVFTAGGGVGRNTIMVDASTEATFLSSKLYKLVFTISSTGNALINWDWASSSYENFANGEHTVYAFGDNGNLQLQASGGGNDFSMTALSIKPVIQADLSDTYPSIIDVANPTLGVELWDADASTFDSGTHSWVAYGNNTITNDSGALKITYVDQARGAYIWLKDASDLSTNLTVGAIYKITLDAKVNSGSSVTINVTEGLIATTTATVTETTFTKKIIYFTATETTTNYLLVQGMSSGEIVYIDNISMKEVQGNVGAMTSMATDNLTYSSVLPDQSYLTGVNSAYNFIDLDGTDAYVNTDNAFTTTFQDSFSISVWFKADDGQPSGTLRLFGSQNSADKAVQIKINTTGTIDCAYDSGNGNSARTASAVLSNGQETWHHLVAVVDNSSSQIYLYFDSQNQSLDGTLDGDLSSVTMSDYDSTRKVYIGARNNKGTAGNFFSGDMGQVSIFNKALSSGDASAIYNAGRHTNLLDSYSDNCVAYYAFGTLDAITGLADTDSTIYDRSGNSIHGTTVGTATGDLKSPPNADPNGYSKGETNRSTDVK